MDYSFFEKMKDPFFWETLPNSTCTFCNWVGKSYQCPFVYGPPINNTRRVYGMCPECNTIDTIKHVEPGYIPPVKEGRKKRNQK